MWHKFFSIRDDCNKKEPAREENEEKKIRLDVERNVLVEKQDEHEVIRMIRRVITRLGDETMYEWKYHSHSKPKMKNNTSFRYKQGLDMVALTISKFVIKKHPEDYIVSLIEFFSLSEYYSKDEKISSKFLFDRLSFLNALIFFHAPQLCSKLRDQGLGPELYVFSSRVMSYSLVSLKHNTRTPTLEHRYEFQQGQEGGSEGVSYENDRASR